MNSSKKQFLKKSAVSSVTIIPSKVWSNKPAQCDKVLIANISARNGRNLLEWADFANDLPTAKKQMK